MKTATASIWEAERTDLPVVVGALVLGNTVYVTAKGGPLRRFKLDNVERFGELLAIAEIFGTNEGGGVTSFSVDIHNLFDPLDQVLTWYIYGKRYEYERYDGPVHKYALKLQKEANHVESEQASTNVPGTKRRRTEAR